MAKTWSATLDANTRDVHSDMDGQDADENGIFHLPDGVESEAPGNTVIEEDDINCRCTVTVRVENFERKLRKDNISEELIQIKEYNNRKKFKNFYK